MSTSTPGSSTFQRVVRWTARITSVPVILIFLLMFLLDEGFPETVKPNEWIMLIFGPFTLIVGLILGWWKEGLGGVITLVGFLGAMVVGDFSASGAGYFLICAAPGFLFLLSWILSKPSWKLPAWMIKELPASEEKPPPPSSEKP